REAKAQKKMAAVAQRAAKDAERSARRAAQGADVRFTGSLSTKNKDDLIDIATALVISTDGTKSDVLKAIKDHFEANPELKSDTRFTELFSNRSRGQKRA
ncbi:hypothetical protein L210DRAFT_3334054, partial [Boletus edulis BED1]